MDGDVEVPKGITEEAAWALIDYDGTPEDRGIPSQDHFAERMGDSRRVGPIFWEAALKSLTGQDPVDAYRSAWRAKRIELMAGRDEDNIEFEEWVSIHTATERAGLEAVATASGADQAFLRPLQDAWAGLDEDAHAQIAQASPELARALRAVALKKVGD